jgi:DNA-directed RNA polymerase sigma subunit (sigma70/sigma32)
MSRRDPERLHSLNWMRQREWVAGFDLDGLEERYARILKKRYGLGMWSVHPMTYGEIGESEISRKCHLPGRPKFLSRERSAQLVRRAVRKLQDIVAG